MALSVYTSKYTAAEVDTLLDEVNSPDTTVTSGSTNLITSGAVKAYVDSVMPIPISDSNITVSTTFSANSVVNVDGEMYMASSSTSAYPKTLVSQGNNIVTVDGDGVTYGSASADWEQI